MLPFAWELVPPDERVLVAVSSGADSTALLLALRESGRDIVAGHVHHDLHELRNGDCDRDEAWLRVSCAAWQVPLRVARLELPRRAGHVNEAVAREARYHALSEMAHAEGCTRVATAHTAHDTLETLLLFWLRGATVRGWGGIAPQRDLGGVALVRPLLRATREQTRTFCQARGQTWREDASNLSPHFARNRVRHELLPLLENLSGKPSQTLAQQSARGCELLRDDAAFLDQAAQTALTAITLRQSGGLRVMDGLRWRELALALQRRTLLQAAREMGGAPNAGHIETVRLHAQTEEGARRVVWSWPGGVQCEWTGPGSGNRLRVRRVPNANDSAV